LASLLLRINGSLSPNPLAKRKKSTKSTKLLTFSFTLLKNCQIKSLLRLIVRKNLLTNHSNDGFVKLKIFN